MTTEKALQKSDPNEIVAGSLTRGEVATLKQTLTPQGINDAQFNLYIQTCAASGLNPFMNHIYAIPYKGRMNIQISVDGIHYLARKHPDYITASAEIVGENEVESFEAELLDGEFRIVKHKISLPLRGKAVAAYAIARRKDAPDQIIFMDRSEVEHMEKGINPLWKSNFNDMFKKHVMKRVLKAQFGVDIDDHSIEGSRDAVQENARETQRREINIDENESVSEEELRKQVEKEIEEIMTTKSMSGDDLQSLAVRQFEKPTEQLTLQQLTGLKRFVELHQPPKPKKQQEEPIDVVYTEVPESVPNEPEEPQKPSVNDMNFEEFDFDAMQEEFPFDK
jgi:recombination protein RecT